MARCARLMRIMRGVGFLCFVLPLTFLLAWFAQVLLCVQSELKPQPWLSGYPARLHSCREDGWFSVGSGTLFLWVVFTATGFLLQAWDRRRRQDPQKGRESNGSTTGKD